MAKPTETHKYKLTLSIDHQVARKFAAFCAFKGEDQSAIVTRAVKREMRGFQVRCTEVGDDQTEPSNESSVRLSVRLEDQREAS
jgi:hypothetical protein